MTLLNTCLISAAVTAISSLAGAWFCNPAMALDTNDERLVTTIRKVRRAFLLVGCVGVAAALSLYALIAFGLFPLEFLLAIEDPLGAALWFPPIGLATMLFFVGGK